MSVEQSPKNDYRCPECPWVHTAHPVYGWGRHDDRAVEVHQAMLCPALLGPNRALRHEFDSGYTGLSDRCNALVERDGYGEDCGLPREHPAHRVTPNPYDWPAEALERLLTAIEELDQ